MGKRIVSVLLICILLTVSLSGCFGKTKAGKTFSMPITDEPTSLDPQIADSNAERLVISNCYEGLVTVGADGTIHNGVAESYSVSDNGLVYTFKLRQDAHWALYSGHKTLLGENYKETFDKTVYAQDFVFALQRAVDPQTGSPDAYLFSAISGAQAIFTGAAPVSSLGVQALDNFTVQITLAYADDNLLYALTSPGAMPCDEEFFNLTNGRYGLEAGYTLGNGPFHVSSWQEKTLIKMVHNEDYNGETDVKPSSLTLYYNDDASKIPEKMASGTYDAAFLSKMQFDALEDTSDLAVQPLENTTQSLIFNQRNTSLANENLRKALCYAADLSDFSALGENIERATGLVPPYCKIGADAYRQEGQSANLLPYNAELAKSCFEEALLELGASSVELEILCTDEDSDFIRKIVQNWQKVLGVKFVTTLKIVSQTELEAEVADGNFTVALYPLTATSVMTADFLETAFSSDNLFGFTDANYTSMLSGLRTSASDFSKLRTACNAAEDYLLQHAVILPLFYQESYFVTSDDTAGIYFYSSEDYVYFIDATKK